jgi:hypothetical protein
MNSRFRLVAAAAAIVAFLAYGPSARAQYAFGYSYYDGAETLTLGLASGGSVVLNTNGFQGWFSESNYNAAGPDSNTNYITGEISGTFYNNFFDFNISGLVGETVTSAVLTITPFSISNNLIYSLFDVTTPTAQLFDGASPDAAIYTDLGSGVLYGSYGVSPGDTTEVLTLNANGVSGINAAIALGSTNFNIGGTVNQPVPEPVSLSLLGGGIVALGFFRRRNVA